MRYATLLLPTAISMALALSILLVPTLAQADPPRTPSVSCTAGGLRSPPKFTQTSPGRAEYNFSGACTTRDGRSFAYRVDGTWTPTETAGTNANASEVYHIDMVSGPSETLLLVIGWRCDVDPWLHDVACARIGDNLSDESHALWPELGEGSWPSSRRGIPLDQRAALLAEYGRANGTVDRSQLLTDGVRIEGNDRRGLAVPSYVDRATRVVDKVALNPQPLPPGPPDPDLIQSTSSRVDQVTLNPQPLPPGPPDPDLAQSASSRVDDVALNPQPLPPGPPDAPLAQPATSSAAQRGIIIVSGKTRPIDAAELKSVSQAIDPSPPHETDVVPIH